MPRRKYSTICYERRMFLTRTPSILGSLVSCIRHPWSLWNIQNPGLFGNGSSLAEITRNSVPYFMVIYAPIYRGSILLATKYYITLSERGDSSLYASALAVIAPSMNDSGLFLVTRMLLAPRTQEEFVSLIRTSRVNAGEAFQGKLFHGLWPSPRTEPSVKVSPHFCAGCYHNPGETRRRTQWREGPIIYVHGNISTTGKEDQSSQNWNLAGWIVWP